MNYAGFIWRCQAEVTSAVALHEIHSWAGLPLQSAPQGRKGEMSWGGRPPLQAQACRQSVKARVERWQVYRTVFAWERGAQKKILDPRIFVC